MRRRHCLGLAGLLLLAGLAGCLGPTEISDDQLTGNASYDWDVDAEAAYTVSRSSYQAVYNVSNRSTLSVYNRNTLDIESPVRIETLQFRFDNGTVVNATHPDLTASLGQRRTDVSLPAEYGRVAYTAPRSGKQFSTPIAVPGTQMVTLPPGARVGVPLLSHVNPGNHSTAVTDGRMTIRWPGVEDGTISVQYYLQRDLLLFGGLLLVALVVGAGGLLYYVRQIRQLESVREEIGLDVDDGDDPRDRGPPPGMR